MRLSTFLATVFVTTTAAHGTHHGGGGAGGGGGGGGGDVQGSTTYGEEARTDYPNWMARHMAEEHGMDSFDALSFFTLHDFDGDGVWERDEMLRLYGLIDVTNRGVGAARRDEIYRELLRLLDTDGNGVVSRDEFVRFADGDTGDDDGDDDGDAGNQLPRHSLPDMGTGPGHHGDDEHEYELHHWNKFHNEQTTLDDLTHPEDVAHFKRHEDLEDAEAKQLAMDRLAIVEANIPAKFLRVQR